MPEPRMIIVAGPSGGGKSSLFPISKIEGVAAFSTDDYCANLYAQRLGRSAPVYAGIPPDIREQGGRAFQQFIENKINARLSLSFETTLRDITFDQARLAKNSGFRVEMIFVAAGPVEEHIERVKNRAQAGGHSAPESSLREIYSRGMKLLLRAFDENRKGNIETFAVFHNPRSTREADLTPSRATLIVEMVRGDPAQLLPEPPPAWFEAAVMSTSFEIEKLRERARDYFQR